MCFCTCFFLLCVCLCRCLSLSTLLQRNPQSIHAWTQRIFEPLRQTCHKNDCYNRATVIIESVVQMETLEKTSILEVFKERTWTKLLNPSGNVYVELIREFFSNATVEGDHINCWVLQKEFIITRDSIQEFLEVRPPSQQITTQYDDRLDSLEPMAELLVGSLKKKSMNTIPFNAEMRTLAYVMIHDLYSVIDNIVWSKNHFLQIVFLFLTTWTE